MISLVIEIAPEPQTVKKGEVSAKLSWLQINIAHLLKHPLDKADENDAKNKKAKTAATASVSTIANTVIRHIQVSDP